MSIALISLFLITMSKAAITKIKEPRYYHEAARDAKWRVAMA